MTPSMPDRPSAALRERLTGWEAHKPRTIQEADDDFAELVAIVGDALAELARVEKELADVKRHNAGIGQDRAVLSSAIGALVRAAEHFAKTAVISVERTELEQALAAAPLAAFRRA